MFSHVSVEISTNIIDFFNSKTCQSEPILQMLKHIETHNQCLLKGVYHLYLHEIYVQKRNKLVVNDLDSADNKDRIETWDKIKECEKFTHDNKDSFLNDKKGQFNSKSVHRWKDKDDNLEEQEIISHLNEDLKEWYAWHWHPPVMYSILLCIVFCYV